MATQEQVKGTKGMTILQRLSLLAAIGVVITLIAHYLR